MRLLRMSFLIEARDPSFAKDRALSCLPELAPGFLSSELNCPLTPGSEGTQLTLKTCLAFSFCFLVLRFAIDFGFLTQVYQDVKMFELLSYSPR